MDLNGNIAIWAKAADQPQPTEVVLKGSEWSGEPIRINTNRKYLARATKLGFQELLVYGDKVPVLCQDDRRQYVWALLEPESAIAPDEDAIRIESPGRESKKPVTKPQTRRRVSSVPEPTNPNGNAASNGNSQSNGHAKANGQNRVNGQARNGAARKPGQDIDGLIRQVEALRQAQRDAATKTHELLKGLKRHRRQTRAFQNTIASLRQLKGLGV